MLLWTLRAGGTGYWADIIAAKEVAPSSKEKWSKFRAWLRKRLARATCSCSLSDKAGPWRVPYLNCKTSSGLALLDGPGCF